MMRQYYYLITSLKDISYETDKLPYVIEELLENCFYEIGEPDSDLIRSLLYHYDNINLVNILEKKDIFLKGGTYSREELEMGLKDLEHLPSYMLDFLHKIKDEEREFPIHSLENELTVHYYRYLIGLSNQFLSDYVAFDFSIRNIITALSARKHHIEREDMVLPLDQFYSTLIQSTVSDFGLVHDIVCLQDLISIFEEGNPLEREKDLLEYRFRYIDSQLKYDYFNINVILGHILKFMILDRLFKFDQKRGREIFEQITDRLSDDKLVFAQLAN